MKKIFRSFLFHIFSLWFTSQLIPGLIIHNVWPGILMASLVLSLLMFIVKPILKIVFIPINLITFGLMSWFINVIVIYLLTLFVPEVEVIPWIFPGWSYQGFSVPSFELNYFMSLVAITFSVTFFGNMLDSLSDN